MRRALKVSERAVPASLRSTELTPSTVLAAVLGTAAVLLPQVGRHVGVASLALTTLAVLLVLRRPTDGTVRALTAAVVGLLPAVVLLGALHDLPGFALPLPISRLLLLTIWSLTSATLGLTVTRRIIGKRALADVWVRLLAGLGVTVYFAGALLRLLRPDRSPSARLAWILSEEDNAHIVGVLREVLLDGPRGAQLADQFGTAFANVPLTILALFGGPLAGEDDIRIQAITGFTVSTIVAIALGGSALALLAALPHHVQRFDATMSQPPVTALRMLFGGLLAAAAVLAAGSLLIVLPMRSGFLTLVWGLALVLVSSALIAITPTDAPSGTRIMLVASILGVAVLLLSSWPFIITALAPALALPLTWVRWRRLAALIRQHRARSAGAVAVGGTVLVAGITWFLRWGPAAEVLSYGRDILLVQASGIFADANIVRISAIALLVATTMIVLSNATSGRIPLLLALLGPPVGAGMLYLGLRVAAAILTEGELNYSGIKLFYAIIVLTVALGLTALAAHAPRSGPAGIIGGGLLLALVHSVSPTVNLHTEWWNRTDLAGAAHATAVVDAIANSSPELPIRCLPPLGTPATPVTRWAAYFCVRWMEDAFNEGRFNGGHQTFLRTEDATFDGIIEQLLRDNPSEYTFAYRMQMGLGWFGWDGRT